MKKKPDSVEASCWVADLLVAPATSSMRRWKLMRDFPVHIRVGVRVQSVVVPKGFVTDFASVPRILHAVFPPMGKYGAAALVHDYLRVETLVSPKEADKLFYSIMVRHGVKSWKARIMYAAVRLYAILTGVDNRERSRNPESIGDTPEP